MKIRVIDHTGDSVENFDSVIDAKGRFKELSKTHLAYDAADNAVIRDLTPSTKEVIFTSKLVGG